MKKKNKNARMEAGIGGVRVRETIVRWLLQMNPFYL